jgi:hypothetical protein
MHAAESLLRRHHSVGGDDIDTERRGRNRPPLLLKKGETKKKRKRRKRSEPDNSQRKGSSDGKFVRTRLMTRSCSTSTAYRYVSIRTIARVKTTLSSKIYPNLFWYCRYSK